MTGEVIKSFLVGLGFKVDDASLGAFNKAIAVASTRVAALYASVKIAAAGIVYGISEISEGFEQMGYEYRLIAPSINKTIQLRKEMLRAYREAGVNIIKVIQDSIRLNISLTKTKYAFEAIYRSVASRFFVLLTKQSDAFRQKLYANMPKIQAVLERIVNFVFKAFEATSIFGKRLGSVLSRIYDFFVDLDKATHGLSTAVIGLIAAWQALNLSFLASPLGLILAGLTAILLLYDDFKTFQEGGESFFNWKSAIPAITAVTNTLKALWSVFKSIADVIADVTYGLYLLFTGDTKGFGDQMLLVVDHLKQAFIGLKDAIKGNLSFLYELAKWGAGLLGIKTDGSPQPTPNTFIPTLTHPIGSTTSSSSSVNQTIKMQNDITVNSTADASQVGKSVVSESTRVNFDGYRNFASRMA